MKIKFAGLWLRLKKMWRGYDVLRFHFRSGNVVDVRVTEWTFNRSTTSTGGVGGYNITYHPTTRYKLMCPQLDQIECVVVVR